MSGRLTEKPGRWAPRRDLVGPEWHFAWDGLVYGLALWEGAGTTLRNPIGGPSSLVATLQNGPTWTRQGLRFAGGVNERVSIPEHNALQGPVGTVIVVMNNCTGAWGVDGGSGGTGARGTATLVAHCDATSSFNGWSVQLSTTGVVNAINKFGSSTAVTVTGTTNVCDGGRHVIGYAFKKTSALGNSVYVDGKLEATANNTSSWVYVSPQLFLADSADTFFEEYAGDIELVLFYKRAMFQGEMQRIAEDPFGLIRPRKRAFALALPATAPATAGRRRFATLIG